jgi:hypothetical protein
MKTPEELAEGYLDQDEVACSAIDHAAEHLVKKAFLDGYQAAKDKYNAKMQELEANWKFCCEDKARLLKELAAAEKAKDQLADTSKVICNTTMQEIQAVDTGELMPITNLPMPAKWISVKERLPEEGGEVLTFDGRFVTTGYIALLPKPKLEPPQFTNVDIFRWVFCGPLYDEYDAVITHWMPLPSVEGLKHED